MRIRTIYVEFEDVQDHASHCQFSDGKWTFDGPVYNRISSALIQMYRIIRAEMKDEKFKGEPLHEGRENSLVSGRRENQYVPKGVDGLPQDVARRP